MPVHDIVVPEIGQGQHEVRVLALLKQVGEWIERDEPLYEVETSKADVVLESPVRGRLTEWLVAVGDEVAVGACVGRIEVETAEVAVAPARVSTDGPASSPGAPLIPPRTRAYARSLGLDDRQLAEIPAAGRRLLPDDVDRYLSATADRAGADWVERPLPSLQRQFISQLRHTQTTAIPATVSHPLPWDAIRQVVREHRGRLSEFHALAYCVVRATREHPLFRATLIDERVVREHQHLHLGVGVEVPPDALAVAVLERADAYGPNEFVVALRACVKAALRGGRPGPTAAQLLLSYLPRRGVRQATPVLVSPAVATLFVGQPAERDGHWTAWASLTFDHRLINGGPAARFLRSVADEVRRAGEHDWGG